MPRAANAQNHVYAQGCNENIHGGPRQRTFECAASQTDLFALAITIHASTSSCRPPLMAARQLLHTSSAALSLLVRTWGAFLGAAVAGVVGPPVKALTIAARAVQEMIVPIWKVLASWSIYTPILQKTWEPMIQWSSSLAVLHLHCTGMPSSIM